MKILLRYLYKKLTIYLLVIVPSFTFVAMLMEIIEILRKVKKIDYGDIFLYSIFQSPEKVYYILPVSVVLAFFLLARDLINSREIYPILLNGISIKKIGLSLFIFPLFISAVQIANLEIVIPQAKKKAESIYQSLKEEKISEPVIAYNTWVTMNKKTFVYFSFLDLLRKRGKGIKLVIFSKDFTPSLIVEGKSFQIGKYIKVFSGKVVTLKGTDELHVKYFKEFTFPEKIDLDNFRKLIKVKKPISIKQLYTSAKIAEEYGYPSSYYWSKMYSKVATVIAPLILSFSLYPLIWSRKKFNIAVISLLILLYWYSAAFLSSLSQTGVIPYYSVLSVDLLFLIFGFLFFRKLKFSEL
ncbi:LptF/LptG family permease [Persephonella atlantica]|uniref:LptF/LptG family permease n=1 Tax=Persephonella atlantica TaxID=2699429 RepID=A0ABS1GJU4_9AQUI|nr:LptF/LptG family permease [Persephonella atlantica]MBK3333155.1 LptF/LptG family permease [Persephonella atlantica]